MTQPVIIGRWKCENCGDRFDRDKSGNRPIRFCGQKCYHSYAKSNSAYRGTFPKNHKPWNKNLKGLHLSPETEFKKGCESNRKLPVGSGVIRQHKGDQRRAWVKVLEPDVWKPRAIANWESVNGPVPEGCVIHHKDRNAMNDDIANLQCMTRAEHIDEHHSEIRRKIDGQ